MSKDLRDFLISIVLLFLVVFGGYVINEYFDSYSKFNMKENVSKVYGSPCTIIATKDELNKKFILFRDNKNNDLGMMYFEKSEIFKDRYTGGGGSYGRVNGVRPSGNYSSYMLTFGQEYSLLVVWGDNALIKADKLQVTQGERLITTDLSSKKEFLEIYWGGYKDQAGKVMFN